jgi:hypothetical protein
MIRQPANPTRAGRKYPLTARSGSATSTTCGRAFVGAGELSKTRRPPAWVGDWAGSRSATAVVDGLLDAKLVNRGSPGVRMTQLRKGGETPTVWRLKEQRRHRPLAGCAFSKADLTQIRTKSKNPYPNSGIVRRMPHTFALLLTK